MESKKMLVDQCEFYDSVARRWRLESLMKIFPISEIQFRGQILDYLGPLSRVKGCDEHTRYKGYGSKFYISGEYREKSCYNYTM